jgi:Telomerase activating protein Est1/Est1 DNA/RNA binding domain
MRRQQQQQQQRHPFSPSLLSGATQSQSQDDNNNAVMAISAQEADDRAKALEQQLAQLETSTEGASKNKKSSSSKNDQANALRVQICELLADLMLTDPLHASRHNVMERMWRKCFYVRISHLRAKLAAHKRKQKSNANNESSSASTTSIATLEQHLVFFLGEAIVLYTYLVEKLEEKLVEWVAPLSSLRSGFGVEAEESEDDEDGVDDDVNAPQARAAVECLHRLYICLGDLHRYTATATSTAGLLPTNNRAALKSYDVSAQLGPGMGHPANQLGVMCGSQILAGSNSAKSSTTSTSPQQQNQSAVGLYWYARSLLASHEPFETTYVNLQRLFQANQLWLDRNQQQQQHQQSQQPPASTVAASKSLQASLFLAQYVQFHGQLLLSDDESSSFLTSNDVVTSAMEGVTHGLASLLKQSALSDSLLVKAVAIQAFTESYGTSAAAAAINHQHRGDGIPRTVSVAIGATTTTTTTEPEPNPTLALRRLWGRVSTLRMGTVLADRILSTLQQRSQQQQQTYASAASATTAAPSVPTVRLLLPLLLLTEYVRHTTAELESTTLRSSEVSSGLRETYRTCSHDLWERVAHILNVIGPMVPAELAASIVAVSRDANASSARFLPAEYLSLRGYTPFASFIPQGKGSGFLSPRHAVQVLREEKASAASAPPTQDTAPQAAVGGAASGAGKASHESNRIKLVSRFWMVGRELASDDGSSETLRGFQRSRDGRFAYEATTYENLQPMNRADEPNKMVEDSGDKDDDGGDTLNVLMDDDPVVVEDKQAAMAENSDGVLVYKAGSVGGPALLVPGALLANAASVEDTIVAPSVPPFATTPLPPPAPTGMAGVDLGWLNGPNPQVPIGMIATTRTSEAMEVDRANVFESLAPPLPQPPAVLGDHFLGAIAASAMTAPSMNDAAQPSTVLPPPGFGTLARSFALYDAQQPTQPRQELSILEASGQLFGALPHTANPFVTMPPPTSYPFPPQSPQGFAASHPAHSMFPYHSNDALWMAQDVLGGDETYETSLLDSGLLNSLLNDDAAATTKNPFAT